MFVIGGYGGVLLTAFALNLKEARAIRLEEEDAQARLDVANFLLNHYGKPIEKE